MSPEHKILDALQHLWPYVSGVFLITIAGAKLWYHDRKTTKHRIVTLEKLAENAPTKQDLRECSDEKDEQHHSGIKDVLSELQAVRSEIRGTTETNSQQHLDILSKITDLHLHD